jgi:hypothetical protein
MFPETFLQSRRKSKRWSLFLELLMEMLRPPAHFEAQGFLQNVVVPWLDILTGLDPYLVRRNLSDSIIIIRQMAKTY